MKFIIRKKWLTGNSTGFLYAWNWGSGLAWSRLASRIDYFDDDSSETVPMPISIDFYKSKEAAVNVVLAFLEHEAEELRIPAGNWIRVGDRFISSFNYVGADEPFLIEIKAVSDEAAKDDSHPFWKDLLGEQ